MNTTRLRFLLLLLLLSSPSAGADTAADTVVTEANLLANDRFWPERVALPTPWKPPALGYELRAGIPGGALIRVQDGGVARVDFGADGIYEVPVGRTDLVEQANRIRRGEQEKEESILVRLLGTRIVSADEGRALGSAVVAAQPGFLCVFADPDAASFEGLAVALRPLQRRHGVLTVLFAQGDHPDAELIRRLRDLEWPVSAVLDFLSEAYSRVLIGRLGPPPDVEKATAEVDPLELPLVLLLTPDARVLYRGTWTPKGGAVADLTASLDASFGGPAAPATASGDPADDPV